MIIPEFTAPSYRDRTLNEVQDCRNLTPVKAGNGWKLVSTPGLNLLGTVTNDEGCRGAYLASNGRSYSVNGNTVYEVYQDGTFVSRGTLSASSGYVSMVDNGIHLLIVQHAVNGYTLGLSSGSPSLIVDSNFPSSPGRCAFLDSYFVVPKLGTALFYLSQLSDGSDWTPVQFATAEGAPDLLLAPVTAGQTLYNFGAKSLEGWYNTGNPSFPLERISGAFYQVGAMSDMVPAELNGAIYFLGAAESGSGAVWRISPAGLERISTPQIEAMITQYGSSATWEGIAYNYDGQSFYELSVPSFGKTFLYNITSNAWSRVTSGSDHHRIRAVTGPNRAASTYPLAFDRSNGKVYELTPAANDEDGTAITRTRAFGPIGDGTRHLFHDRIEFVLEADHDSEASYTLSATLEWSDNGGLSWSSAVTLSKAITSGTTGQTVVLYHNRLGSSKERFYRLTFTGPSAKLILKTCDLEFRAGRH